MRKKIGDPKGPAASSGFAPPQKPAPSNRKHKEHTLVCLKCKRTFALLRHLKKHTQGHEKNDCELCDALFTSRKQLVTHMREVHERRIAECQHLCRFCDKSFTRRYSLFKHYQLVHARDRAVCLLCGDIFNNKAELEQHTETHEQTQLACPLCHQTFSRRQQYNAHLQSHEKYQCLTCNKGFSAWKVLMEHQQSGHKVSVDKPSLKCETCSRQFIRASCLQKHQKRHSIAKVRRCQPCARSFLSAGAYENHLLSKNHKLLLPTSTKNGSKDFKCQICLKSFESPKSLSVHQDRVHHNRIYECHVCQYRTKFKTNLTRHIKLHFNDRSVVCELCGSAFFNMSALKDHHTFLHTESRDHECPTCSRTFKRPSELTRHMKIHSDSRPYVCTSCAKGFKRSSHLKRHREKCHNDPTTGRAVDRFTTDENGLLVLRPVEKRSKKKPQLEVLEMREDDPDDPAEDDCLNLAPILSSAGDHYYVNVTSEGAQDTLYITTGQSQPMNLQICLEQPIDLEMPKNYVSGETLDLAKPRHHFELLDPRQMADDLFGREPSPQTPLYLTDLSRYPDPQLPVVADLRQAGDALLRDEHQMAISADLTAEDMRIQQQQFHYM